MGEGAPGGLGGTGGFDLVRKLFLTPLSLDCFHFHGPRDLPAVGHYSTAALIFLKKAVCTPRGANGSGSQQAAEDLRKRPSLEMLVRRMICLT